MKKLFFLSFLFFCIYGCKTVSPSNAPLSIEDNTFEAEIKNNSYFTVDIDGKTVKAEQSVTHSFPLHDAALYDGWTVHYTVPLTQDVFHIHKDKLLITDRQKKINIKNPANIPQVSYIVVKNSSKHGIQLTNGLGTIFPCSVKGRINALKAESVYIIAPHQSAVYDFSRIQKMYISVNNKNYLLRDTLYAKAGYVYTYAFDGQRVIKEDERPLLKINESLWKNTDREHVCLSKIISDDNGENFYAVGTEKQVDVHGNNYYAAYIQCIDSSGNEKWSDCFTEHNCDAALYGAAVFDNGNILAVGQSTREQHTGLLLLYSKDGILLKYKKVEQSSSLHHIVKLTGGTYTITGFDADNTLLLLTVAVKNNTLQYHHFNITLPFNTLNENEEILDVIPLYDPAEKTLFLFCNCIDTETEKIQPPVLYAVAENGTAKKITLQNTIKNIAAVVRDKNGTFYIGGESNTAEHSIAMIITFDYAHKKESVFYTGGKSFAYTSDIRLNENTNELIVSGTEDAADGFGNKGRAFIKSFDTASGKELWSKTYKDKTSELLSSFVSCPDYGFIGVFTNVNEDGEYIFPAYIKRLTATGESL